MNLKLHRIILDSNLHDCRISNCSIAGHMTHKWGQCSKGRIVIASLRLKPRYRNVIASLQYNTRRYSIILDNILYDSKNSNFSIFGH